MTVEQPKTSPENGERGRGNDFSHCHAALGIGATILIPLVGAITGDLSSVEAARTFLICGFPLLLIFRPKFIVAFFRSDVTPLLLGWFGFLAIFLQAFCFRWLLQL